ncbi:MAG TPA: hypothetical protein VFO00_10205 [Vitreimonas sp.]|nr:hypothetical protein [Vitreimonas sp.]
MISRRQLAIAAAYAKRSGKERARRFNVDSRRNGSRPASVWSWLAYGVAAFVLALALSYCSVQVLETAARIAG